MGDVEIHEQLHKCICGLYTPNIHKRTFYRFMRVRWTKLGHISGPKTRKLAADRTKYVQALSGNASKPLI
jgi:hypothetical protein